jgi:hypothetical protein
MFRFVDSELPVFELFPSPTDGHPIRRLGYALSNVIRL